MIISRHIRLLVFFLLADLVLVIVNLFVGSVSIPIAEILQSLGLQQGSPQSVSQIIIIESRLPQALTALLTGAALSVAGLLMQSLFRNPLADPGILGVSSGASLGVAVFTLLGGMGGWLANTPLLQHFSLVLAAFSGAMLSLMLIIFFSQVVKNNVSLLIIGLMVGYAASSLIGFLQFVSQKEQIHSFVLWGLGSFSQVALNDLDFYAVLIIVALSMGLFLIKPLNLFILGENYAANLGVNIKRIRLALIILAGFLTALATAYTGPIAFIGLAVPHLVKIIFRTSDFKTLLPGTILAGMAIALICNVISRLPSLDQAIPINIVTSVFGAPLVIWFLVRNNKSNPVIP